MVVLGDERTIDQDAMFAVRILVDVANLSLSPAVNDPTTAVQVLDHLAETLRMIADSKLPDESGSIADDAVGVRVPVRRWEDFLELGVTEIREYGASSLQVVRRLRALLMESVELAESRGAWPGFAMSIGMEAALALRTGRPRRARDLVEYGLDRLEAVGLAEYVLCSLVRAVAARVAISSGSESDARFHLSRIHRQRPLMTASLPWLSLSVRLEMIKVLIALRDIASARMVQREVDDILRIRPHMGLLAADAVAIRSRLAAITEVGVGRGTLTAAELRVLQFLPTHLTFREIAERLHLSPDTVKSHVVSIYGKLAVSSRRADIENAVDSGLLDGSALRFPLGHGIGPGIG